MFVQRPTILTIAFILINLPERIRSDSVKGLRPFLAPLPDVKVLNEEEEKGDETLIGCGSKQGCWLMPPKCEETNGPKCIHALTYTVDNEGMSITIESKVDDLLQGIMPGTGVFGALGFSLDQTMGDDTVFVCVANSSGQGGVYAAWNDLNSNHIELQATEVLISDAEVSMTNGFLTCSARWNFDGYNRTQPPNRLHNLKDTSHEFYLLFARGHADARTHELYGHALTDGDKFPWISGDAIAFCGDRCGAASGMKWQLDMQQSLLPRRIKHTIAVTHGTLMYISFFALTATGILSARFARSYNVRVCGSSAWFQLHRACQLLAFTCASVGFFLIYWQAGFKTFKCATVCTDDAYAKPVHSILGTITYALMCAQVLAGLLRPSVSSPNRQCWNWMHAVNGILIFAFACTTVMFAFRLPKAGLEFFFDRTPNYFHATTVVTFISCFILLEWYSHKKRYIPEDPDRVEKLHEENLDGEDDQEVSWMPGVLMLFNFVTAVCVTAAISLMLVQAQRGYGFDL